MSNLPSEFWHLILDLIHELFSFAGERRERKEREVRDALFDRTPKG